LTRCREALADEGTQRAADVGRFEVPDQEYEARSATIERGFRQMLRKVDDVTDDVHDDRRLVVRDFQQTLDAK
jgi:hypothetical protein